MKAFHRKIYPDKQSTYGAAEHAPAGATRIKKRAPVFVSLLLALSVVWQHSYAQARGTWSDLFGDENGLNGAVYAIVIDGSGNVYVGGKFTKAGGLPANNIAQWTGNEWKALGDGFNDIVYTLAIGPAGELYAGGAFTASGVVPTEKIARWDGIAWAALASSFDNRGSPGAEPAVFALGVNSLGLVYVGGDFTEINGVEAKGIATWDGTVWREVGGGFEGGGCVDAILDNVLAIEISESEGVYVVGSIGNASGMPVNGMARWTGSAWQMLGSGVDVSACAAVLDVVLYQEEVYVGGGFSEIGGIQATGIAKWTGREWQTLEGRTGDSFSGVVNTIASDRSGIYVGGAAITIGGQQANGIAKWTGSAWQTLEGGLSGDVLVQAIATYEDKVFVGGENVTEAGGKPSFGIALWQNASTSPVENPPEEGLLSLDFDAVYPNPFKEETTIRFSVPPGRVSVVKLEVYDALGRRTAMLLDRPLSPGQHSVQWYAAALPAGVYILRLQRGYDIRTGTIVRTP